jgi:hypothetical protein
MQGLAKLPPYAGESYRGDRVKEDAFREKYAVGKEVVFGAFGSSSKEMEVALNFEHGISGTVPPDSIGVLLVFRSSGGRDISALSAFAHEQEVLLPPGARYVVTQVIDVTDPGARYAAYYARYGASIWAQVNKGQLTWPRRWHEVVCEPAPRAAAKSPT